MKILIPASIIFAAAAIVYGLFDLPLLVQLNVEAYNYER